MKTRMFRKTIGAIGCLAVFGVLSASALQYTINSPNSALSPYAGPYATLDVTWVNNTTANFVFNALPGYALGGNNAGNLSVNATTFTTSGIVPTAYAQAGAGNVSGFGAFNSIVQDNSGGNATIQQLSFTLTDTSGTWATVNDVLKLNSSGYYAAAHIYAIGANGQVLVTGFAGDGGNRVPDAGSTVALLGLALLSLQSVRGFLARK